MYENKSKIFSEKLWLILLKFPCGRGILLKAHEMVVCGCKFITAANRAESAVSIS